VNELRLASAISHRRSPICNIVSKYPYKTAKLNRYFLTMVQIGARRWLIAVSLAIYSRLDRPPLQLGQYLVNHPGRIDADQRLIPAVVFERELLKIESQQVQDRCMNMTVRKLL